jgi:hypothetical protein
MVVTRECPDCGQPVVPGIDDFGITVYIEVSSPYLADDYWNVVLHPKSVRHNCTDSPWWQESWGR